MYGEVGRFANRPYEVGMWVWIPAPDRVEGRLFAGMTIWGLVA